jgi:hypothetical protein
VPESAAQRRVRRVMTAIFGTVVVAGGLAFVYKLYEFFMDLSAQEGLAFAGAHLLTYCLIAAGFLCLLGYAFLKGHFSDIEAPKYDLLESECRHDRESFDHRA